MVNYGLSSAYGRVLRPCKPPDVMQQPISFRTANQMGSSDSSAVQRPKGAKLAGVTPFFRARVCWLLRGRGGEKHSGWLIGLGKVCLYFHRDWRLRGRPDERSGKSPPRPRSGYLDKTIRSFEVSDARLGQNQFEVLLEIGCGRRGKVGEPSR
jgi:hypothetical protein